MHITKSVLLWAGLLVGSHADLGDHLQPDYVPRLRGNRNLIEFL